MCCFCRHECRGVVPNVIVEQEDDAEYMAFHQKLLTGEVQIHICGSQLTAEQESQARAIAQEHGLNIFTVREALAAGLTIQEIVGDF
jgi:hypothetical protein